jgi:hypothetical protein
VRRRLPRRRADVGIPAEAINDFVRAEAEGLPMRKNHGAFDLLPHQSQDLVTTLASGGSFSILADDVIAAAWEATRDVFMAAYQRWLPGRRPQGWWRFDSPDEELRVVKRERHRCPEWEPEAVYLRRHKLLTAAEQAALRERRSRPKGSAREA